MTPHIGFDPTQLVRLHTRHVESAYRSLSQVSSIIKCTSRFLYVCDYDAFSSRDKLYLQKKNIVTVKMSHVLHGNSYFRVQVFFESEIVNQYPTFRNHIKELHDNRKANWCSAFRHDT